MDGSLYVGSTYDNTAPALRAGSAAWRRSFRLIYVGDVDPPAAGGGLGDVFNVQPLKGGWNRALTTANPKVSSDAAGFVRDRISHVYGDIPVAINNRAGKNAQVRMDVRYSLFCDFQERDDMNRSMVILQEANLPVRRIQEVMVHARDILSSSEHNREDLRRILRLKVEQLCQGQEGTLQGEVGTVEHSVVPDGKASGPKGMARYRSTFSNVEPDTAAVGFFYKGLTCPNARDLGRMLASTFIYPHLTGAFTSANGNVRAARIVQDCLVAVGKPVPPVIEQAASTEPVQSRTYYCLLNDMLDESDAKQLERILRSVGFDIGALQCIWKLSVKIANGTPGSVEYDADKATLVTAVQNFCGQYPVVGG